MRHSAICYLNKIFHFRHHTYDASAVICRLSVNAAESRQRSMMAARQRVRDPTPNNTCLPIKSTDMQLNINDKTYQVEVEDDTPLLWVIRDDLDLTGTKYGCGLAQCGACSVMVDGAIVRSCVTPVSTVIGKKVSTIESVESDDVGRRVVAAWIKHQVPQCGYCQSGQVMAATALLKEVPHPTEQDIAAAMVNLCRCGTYNAIRAAIYDVAGIAEKAPRQVAADTNESTLLASAGAIKPTAAMLFASIATVRAVGAVPSEVSTGKEDA
jgi:isoquinoline 1-oxidoreductase alpha subunit